MILQLDLAAFFFLVKRKIRSGKTQKGSPSESFPDRLELRLGTQDVVEGGWTPWEGGVSQAVLRLLTGRKEIDDKRWEVA